MTDKLCLSGPLLITLPAFLEFVAELYNNTFDEAASLMYVLRLEYMCNIQLYSAIFITLLFCYYL